MTTSFDSNDELVLSIPVIAKRDGRQWQLTYRDRCLECGRLHRYGGGTGPEPDLGSGWWTTHCLKTEDVMVHLVLDGTEQ